MNLTFSGGEFLMIYEIGVAAGLVDYAPDLVRSLNSVSSASAGSFSAIGLLLFPTKLKEFVPICIETFAYLKKNSFGLFHPQLNIPKLIQEMLEPFIPENAHSIVNDKLYLSLTQVKGMKNILISRFHSREDLIECLRCTCFIPIWSGFQLPKYRGEYYMDGTISNNIPIPFGAHATITVTVDPGMGIISPGDVALYGLAQRNQQIPQTASLSVECLLRTYRCLIPPDKKRAYELYYQDSTAIPSNILYSYHCESEIPIHSINRNVAVTEANYGSSKEDAIVKFLHIGIEEVFQWIPDHCKTIVERDLERNISDWISVEYLREYLKKDYQRLQKLGAISEMICRENMACTKYGRQYNRRAFTIFN
ncbi:uncharacterized protein TRIADDRAFT_51458 [Trichoplax adhaerens]|uniref:PNPLA domain-containing protein n=1 Tax=Trichoplax adhaerens TaxID=10228 RepID=B3RJ97_TRIAD|nr:hypothetical protein TRIADDRAFT_51458 [Trichoplax adhaerens]EDV29291.1 hypothetical protein TRIADDRAFT_51458 [Trichoplax adhaerens]|eukprot:XP_002108493.1 hypothetical protein TRIADDRAFT_51458 [Trichoplax adhaerens]